MRLILNCGREPRNLPPAVLKSLIAQESKFNATVINSYGYAGIAQFGRPAAREVGLNVGIAGSASDERLDPSKAIPGAARLLNIKAKRLGEIAFSRYGQPDGIEFFHLINNHTVTGKGYQSSIKMGRKKDVFPANMTSDRESIENS